MPRKFRIKKKSRRRFPRKKSGRKKYAFSRHVKNIVAKLNETKYIDHLENVGVAVDEYIQWTPKAAVESIVQGTAAN